MPPSLLVVVKEIFLGGTKFCCCLPVRVGVIAMSFLGILFAGILTVLLWFEVATSPSFTSTEKAAFTVGGLLETFLLAASILGFVGAISRKQLFIQIYAYFIYFHFIANVAVAIYLLYEVSRFTTRAAYDVCLDAIKNAGTQTQCTGFLKVARVVYYIVAGTVLLIEMYGAIIVTRYLRQIKEEKRKGRVARMNDFEIGPEDAVSRKHMSSESDTIPLIAANTSYRFQPAQTPGLFSLDKYAPAQSEFNPYDDIAKDSRPVSSHNLSITSETYSDSRTHSAGQYESPPDEDHYVPDLSP